MPIDVSDGTDGADMLRLMRLLEARRPKLQRLANRALGDAPIPRGADPAAANAYREFRRLARRNWAGKIVRSRVDRMKPRGFFTAADDDEDGDVMARQIMTRSRMDTHMSDFAWNLSTFGRCPLMTDTIATDPDPLAVITVEDPRQVYVELDDLIPGLVSGLVKAYHSDSLNLDVIVYHAPGRVWRATRERKGSGVWKFNPQSFEWDPAYGGAEGQDTGITRVPGSEAVLPHGQGVFEPHIDLLDKIDQGAFQSAVIAVIQAWRQRAIMLPDDADEDEDGNKIDWEQILTLDPGAIWKVPGDTQFWESATVELGQHIEFDRHDLRSLAELTSTPLRTFHSDTAGASAEGAASQKEDNVFAVEDMCTRSGDAQCDIMSVAIELQGDIERSARDEMVMVWEDPARRSLAEIADAWSKTQDMDPKIRYTKILGLSPSEWAEVRTRVTGSALQQRLANGAPTVVVEETVAEDAA